MVLTYFLLGAICCILLFLKIKCSICSELFGEIKSGNRIEESELEKYTEIKTLIELLNINTEIAAMGASNAFQFQAELPWDREKLLIYLDGIINNFSEGNLLKFRKNVRHL